MKFRELHRKEIDQIWKIDRSESIEYIYIYQNGKLVLQPKQQELHGWPKQTQEKYTPILQDCFNRGGTFYGMFQKNHLAGIAVLEKRLIGKNKDRIQLKFMYVARSYRQQGVGRKLFEKVIEKAKELKARKVYVSATPTENTINFYRKLGFVIAAEVDPNLFELEPNDIHMEYAIP